MPYWSIFTRPSFLADSLPITPILILRGHLAVGLLPGQLPGPNRLQDDVISRLLENNRVLDPVLLQKLLF
jgi:hypothetical protein